MKQVAVLLVPAVLLAAHIASAAEVPSALIERLRSQYVPEEDRASDLSEPDRIRRYRAILSEGRWAEQTYGAATNLHEVLALMLAAARGLATLDGSPESRADLMAVARRLCDSNAPGEARLAAGLLIARARLDEFAGSGDSQAAAIEKFVAGYLGTPLEARALLAGADLAKVADVNLAVIGPMPRGFGHELPVVNPLRVKYLDRLEQDHLYEPGVALALEAEGRRPFHGRLVPLRLRTLAGEPLVLPRDMLGRLAVLHFWTAARSGLRGEGGHHTMTNTFRTGRAQGLEFAGINVDGDPAAAASFIRANGMVWPQTCTGLGAADPTFLRFGVPTVPAWWFLSHDGRLLWNNYRDGGHGHVDDWKQGSMVCMERLAMFRDAIERAPYYRSGEFLLDVPEAFAAAAPADGDVPAGELDAIRRAVFVAPWLETNVVRGVERRRHALALGRAAERERPRANNLRLAWQWMLVAARRLALDTGDPDASRLARELAGRLDDAAPADPQALLARYVRLSERIGAEDDGRVLARIADYRRSYAGTSVDWAAGLLSVILACEMGHEPSRVAWTRELCDPARPIPPKLRGFLRDFCILKVDSLYGNYRYLSANPYGMDAPIAGTSTTANAGLPRLDGGLFRTADHAGRTVAFHFWSLACPPRYRRRHKEPPAPDMTPSNTVVVVGVNLDEDRAGVEAFVKDSPEFQGWVHVFSGRGWNDPLAREWDVFSLPRSVWLNSRGQIAGWSRPGMFGGHFKPDG